MGHRAVHYREEEAGGTGMKVWPHLGRLEEGAGVALFLQ